MIFKFWEKQKRISTKKLLLKKLIWKMDIPNKDKTLFLDAIWVVSHENINKLYDNIVVFIKKYELKQIDDIEKNSFVSIDWMTQKEAHTKKKEINAMNFLFTNI